MGRGQINLMDLKPAKYLPIKTLLDTKLNFAYGAAFLFTGKMYVRFVLSLQITHVTLTLQEALERWRRMALTNSVSIIMLVN